MQIANSRIVTCPFCGAEKELLSLLSGNTFGAVQWSDGKMVAPMLPHVSPVQKCPHCGKYYLHYKQEGKVGNCESDEIGRLSYNEWKEAYEQFLTDTTIDDKDRRVILCGVIMAFNDCYYRFNRAPSHSFESTPPKEEYDFFIKVIEEYISIAEGKRPDDILMKAELYREAGMFEQCAETLKTIDDWQGLEKHSRAIYNGIRKRIEDKVTKVFRLGEEYVTREEKLEADKRRAVFERKERIFQEQAKDPRWKVCKHGHCFKNTERECRWCGETDFVERLDENTPIYTKTLYVGIKDDEWVLTDNPQITGQTDRIRSITIDYNGKYRFYYHMDGKNPHPFYSNTIHLEDETTIIGAELVKMCDRIINGQANEIKLSSISKH